MGIRTNSLYAEPNGTAIDWSRIFHALQGPELGLPYGGVVILTRSMCRNWRTICQNVGIDNAEFPVACRTTLKALTQVCVVEGDFGRRSCT